MSSHPKTWYALDVVVDRAGVEAIEFALNELDSLGSEVDSFREANGVPLRVTGFFEALPADSNIRSAVSESLRIHDCAAETVKSVAGRIVEETDWLAEWKKYWRPTHIGCFIIAPPWEAVAESDKIIIRIEPNMAFGTGTHETTQLCLAAIGQRYTSDQSFLDVGTGTGILAIAAAKLAAEPPANHGQIVACDTDADAVKIAIENAAANGVGDRIRFFTGPIDDRAPVFDFVCANLTLDVIAPILPLLIAKAQSILLLSGILAEQEDAVLGELKKNHITNFKIETAGEWISVLINFD